MKKCQIFSQNKLFCQLIVQALEPTLLTPLIIVVDEPVGNAFSLTKELRSQHSLILSQNMCGEYLADLIDISPTTLLTGNVDLEEFLFFCKQADKGKKYHHVPDYISPLTPTERKILRLSAWCLDTSVVAHLLNISNGTLKNHLSNIYSKLNLSGFKALSPYYFGNIENRDLFQKIQKNLINL